MEFTRILKEVVWSLLTEGQVSYYRLKREFGLDEDDLEGLRFELIQVKGWASDLEGRCLVWAGAQRDGLAIASLARVQQLAPISLLDGTPRLRGAVAAPLLPVAPVPGTGGAASAGEAGRPSAIVGPGPTSPTLPAPATDIVLPGAERRQLTVMFCDLVGSTDLSSRLDPEDLSDVIRAYHDATTPIVKQFDGYIAKYMGDGILIYFGYPHGREKDAERAVRTALAILDAMPGLNARVGSTKGVELAVRIGIATGLVVVGETIGSGASEEKTVIGETPNLAARLQGLAGANGIVIGAVTRELTGAVFEYEDLGAHALKGISEPVHAWGVTRLRVQEDDPERAAAADGPVLVGRDEEIGLLLRRWEQSKEGLGQVVLISGEPGIGKSSLVEVLRAYVRQEGLPRLAFRCSEYHQNSALYPIVIHLERVLRFERDDGPEARLEKLERGLQPYNMPLEEAVPLLAGLLGVPVPAERYPPLGLSPQQQRQQTQDTLVAWLLGEAERQPVLAVWEDLHWADPSTLELLALFADQAPTAAMLHVLTYRTDFAVPWPMRSHMTPITLNRLERPQIEVLVRRLAGGKTVPAEVVQHIVMKTDGVPLYVEELTKTVLGSGSLRDDGDSYVVAGPLTDVTIPASLQEMLMARLDRLPTVREVAQLGAVVGREFAYETLQALVPFEETQLQDGLGQLVDAELLYQRGRGTRARYMFKHALVQDAAYQSLLRRTRQRHHEQVALLLETRFPEVVEREPELVAHHFTEAGLAEQAIGYWQRAGQRALLRSALLEGISHLSEGLRLIPSLPESPQRDQRELSLHLAVGPAFIATKGYGAEDVKRTYVRARELCERVGDASQRFAALRGLVNSYRNGGELPEARDLGTQLVALADQAADPRLMVEAHRDLGTTLFFQGELVLAREHLAQGIAIYDPEQHRELAFLYGADPGVVCRLYAALALWLMGSPRQARTRMDEAVAMATSLNHPHTLAFAWAYAGSLHQALGDSKGAVECAERAIGIAGEHGIAQWGAYATIVRGWVLAQQGTAAQGVAQVREGTERLRATGSRLWIPYSHVLLAEAQQQADLQHECLATLEDALGVAKRPGGETFFASELYRLEGELLLTQLPADAEAAEARFREALDLARRQQASSLELRAALSLARLLRARGRGDEARTLLVQVTDAFTDGLETPELGEARTILDAAISA